MGKKIIIIDDDADTRTYMSTILLRGGYEVLTAEDGQEGWQMIQERKPDLVLLDMMMPRRSGMHLLGEIKNSNVFKGLPIIMISGVGQMTGVDMQKHLVENGVDAAKPQAFLDKPVKPDRLLRVVNEALAD